MNQFRNATIAVLGLLLSVGLVVGGGAVLAQDATPAGDHAGHPVHIHEGTCDNLDPAPLYPLNDIVLAAAIEGAQAAEISETTVDAPLSEIANGNFSINVHESAENIENYIACGEIGTLADGDRVAVGLRELNTSGYVGIAVLTANGDQTDVTVYLASGLSGDTQATAAAGHEHEDAAEAAAVTVDIQDFAYNPDPVTIAAGESITWTNQDEAPHTATASDRDILQSGTLQQGDSYTQSFDTAGTYEYFCEFHAGMNGTIIVE